jgi:hypothetical protein
MCPGFGQTRENKHPPGWMDGVKSENTFSLCSCPIARVNMPPTEHHPCLNTPLMHTSAVEWSQSFVQAFGCNPVTKCPVLKKCVRFFYIIQMNFLCGYGHGKKQFKKKGTMLYVIIFDYGRGPAHWICSHVWLWESTITL